MPLSLLCQVKRNLPTSGQLSGEWNSGRLSQLLVNLVANALNHDDADGEVRVDLKAIKMMSFWLFKISD